MGPAIEMRYELRFPKQPWTYDIRDVSPQGDPETVVFLPGARGSIVGLRILGLEDHVMIGIREDTHGQPQSCAITNELQIDVAPSRQGDGDGGDQA